MKTNTWWITLLEILFEFIGEAAVLLAAGAVGLTLRALNWGLHLVVEPKYVPLGWGVVLLAVLAGVTAGLIRQRTGGSSG